MKSQAKFVLIALLLLGILSSSYGLNYAYFSDIEQTRLGDRVYFWVGDTSMGPVRSNDQIALMQTPVFYDFVISSAQDFWRGMAYNPQFRQYQPVFGAPFLELPIHLDSLRQMAVDQGHQFLAGDGMKARLLLGDHTLRIWWAPIGSSFDSIGFSDYPLPDSAVAFFQCPYVEMSGIVHSILIIGTSGQVGLRDNLLYASSDTIDGRLTANHPEKFALLSEGEIKILNTVANGRENSHGAGYNQTNPNYTSIALNGFYFALNESFSFEQQNDADSGYVCDCQPDDRGTIYLWGGLAMSRRNYFHRSTRSSTGYLKSFHYDNDLRFWNLPVFQARENEIAPSSVDFGTILPQQFRADTIWIDNSYVPIKLDSVHTNYPFMATPMNSNSYDWVQRIAIAFMPYETGEFSDSLRFYNAYYHKWFSVPLHGVASSTGVEDAEGELPREFTLSAYPNPFNATTRVQFSLPQGGRTVVEVFDVLGKRVMTLLDGHFEAGQHGVEFDGSALSSGVYMVRLSAGQKNVVMKLMLMK